MVTSGYIRAIVAVLKVVQIGAVSINIVITGPTGKRRKKKETHAARLAAYAEAERELLANYASPPTPPIEKCTHGVLVERGTAKSWYCSVCRDIRVADQPRRIPYRMDQSHPLRLGLKTFPRSGVVRSSKGFYEDWSAAPDYTFIYTPPDNERAPGDYFTPRMHVAAQRGYVNDGGVASRASQPGTVMGMAWDEPDDTGSRRLGIGFSKMLAPWEYDRKDAHLFQRRLFNPIVRLEPHHHTGPAIVVIGGNAARSHQSDVREGWKKPKLRWDDPRSFPQDAQENLRLYLRDGLSSPRWTGGAEATATDKQIEEWREKHWSRGRREWNPKLFGREPWCSCPDCTRYWKSNRSKDWRNDRNNRGTGMRDINGRLGLYDYGTGHLNVERMRATCDGLLWPGHIRFILGSGVNVRQHHWPTEDRIPRGHFASDPTAKAITRSGCVCALCSTAGMPEYRCS